MFRINRKIDYAVRVLLALARRPAGTRLSTGQIQAETRVPGPFLRRIVASLSQSDLIVTFSGPSGGLQLARPAEAINLLHVWQAVEGELLISDCLQQSEPGCPTPNAGLLGPLKACPLQPGCPVNRRWGRLQSLIVEELQAATLAELAFQADSLQAGSNPNFQALTTGD